MARILPPFDQNGDLPPGVYRATLQTIAAELGSTNRRRIQLCSRLQRIYQITTSTGHLRRFIVFGSFVTSKAEPNDVDIFIVMEDEFDSATLSGEARLLFDHGAAQA